MQVRFLKNPVGKYNLSYDVGEVVNLPDLQAMEIANDGYGELILPELVKHETFSKKKIEKR